MPLAVADKAHVAGVHRDDGAVVAVCALALENIIAFAIAVMDVPGDLGPGSEHDAVEHAPLPVHFRLTVEDHMHLSLAIAAEHLLVEDLFLSVSSDDTHIRTPAPRRSK